MKIIFKKKKTFFVRVPAHAVVQKAVPTCPANSSPTSDSTSCKCNDGFQLSVDGSSCVRVAKLEEETNVTGSDGCVGQPSHDRVADVILTIRA